MYLSSLIKNREPITIIAYEKLENIPFKGLCSESFFLNQIGKLHFYLNKFQE